MGVQAAPMKGWINRVYHEAQGRQEERMSMKSRMLAAVLVCVAGVASAQMARMPKAPLVFPSDSVNLKIVNAVFLKTLQGIDARFDETEPDKYRGLVITVEVTKPAGEALELRAQDITLHYHYDGDEYDVAPCQGLSTFSAEQMIDRPMNLFKIRGTARTGIATMSAQKLYIDMFFQYMEPTTSDIHLMVAQPVGASFVTDGWE
jgi:hypothetical protein